MAIKNFHVFTYNVQTQYILKCNLQKSNLKITYMRLMNVNTHYLRQLVTVKKENGILDTHWCSHVPPPNIGLQSAGSQYLNDRTLKSYTKYFLYFVFKKKCIQVKFRKKFSNRLVCNILIYIYIYMFNRWKIKFLNSK